MHYQQLLYTDYQRHTGQWITLTNGTLKECLKYIEEEDGFFNLDSYEYP